jgi:CDP-diacylglycerol--glycerol-3-phosphate 3-phosphatidyltransferase
MTFTGLIGTVSMFPLRAIINASVALGIHPNVLTLIGVLINVVAAWALAEDRFVLAGVIMICANIFDFIDGKVAHLTGTQSQFGAFWDSTLDRFSDLALFTGLIWLYTTLDRPAYVLVATLALIFSIMTSYARARAESLIEKCKVGFMERPERIVLFMIGAFTDRMAAVLWVILVLSIVTVANRIYFTYLALAVRSGASSSGVTSGPRCPTTCGWSPSWRSCGSRRRTGCRIRRRAASACSRRSCASRPYLTRCARSGREPAGPSAVPVIVSPSTSTA